MENSKYFAIITKQGKYPLCSNGDRILLFTPQQLGEAFGNHLSNIRDKLLPKATEFSTLKGDSTHSLAVDTKEVKELNQSKNTKFIILDITDTNNISVVTEKKSILKNNPRTMKFGLFKDATNFVTKLNKKDNTKKYYITHYSQNTDNTLF